MRCHICDRPLNPNEIKYNKDHEEYDPCGVCLTAIEEVFEDNLEEDEIRELVERDEREIYGDIENTS